MLDGQTGWVVPSGDTVALVQAFEQAIGDSAMRGVRGEAGRARFEQHFTMQAMLNTYRALYESMLEGSR